MADPYEVWRSEEGRSRQKSVRTFWPALADALEGGAGGARNEADKRRAMRPDCSIKGPHCAGKAAGEFTGSGRKSCIPCWGGRKGFVRNPEWDLRARPRKATPQERWDGRAQG